MTPKYNVCTCEKWLPNYDEVLICYHCKRPLPKERADKASSFWQQHRPSEFFENAMYNVSKLDVCFNRWLAINEAEKRPSVVE